MSVLSEKDKFYRDMYLAQPDRGKLRDVFHRYEKNMAYYWSDYNQKASSMYQILEMREPLVELDRRPINAIMHARWEPVYLHYHTFFEMIYVVSGSCTNIVEGKTMLLREGDICFLSPRICHMLSVFDESVVVNVVFTHGMVSEFLLPLLSEGIPADQKSVLLSYLRGDRLEGYLLYHLLEKESIARTLEELILEYLQLEPCLSLAQVMFFRFLLQLVLDPAVPAEAGSMSYSKSPRIQEILHYMQQHHASLSRKELAQVFGYSQAYLNKLMKQYTGRTYSSLLHSIRITAACYQLIYSDLSVSDVAENVGYSDSLYFTQLFKRHVGMTPQEYRKWNKILYKVVPASG